MNTLLALLAIEACPNGGGGPSRRSPARNFTGNFVKPRQHPAINNEKLMNLSKKNCALFKIGTPVLLLTTNNTISVAIRILKTDINDKYRRGSTMPCYIQNCDHMVYIYSPPQKKKRTFQRCAASMDGQQWLRAITCSVSVADPKYE